LIHFAISPQFHRYTGEFRLGFPLSYGLTPISASLRRLPGNNHLKLVVEPRQSASEFAGQRNQRNLLPVYNQQHFNADKRGIQWGSLVDIHICALKKH
jgi:hypothetical protein